MASGLARGARARGKLIAFGDGKRLLWDQQSAAIFHGNKNIAHPGQERATNVEWVAFHRGNRWYNKNGGDHWIWNYEFHPTPGELFLYPQEAQFGEQLPKGFVVIEPNVPHWKTVAPNKQWPVDRYEEVARRLTQEGHAVVQLHHGGPNRLKNASSIQSGTFRKGTALLGRSSLYIGPEGGLHHAAAATLWGNDGRRFGGEIPAVVLFGGFIPPQVTGYEFHTNLTGNSTEACGMFRKCDHCIAAMRSIEVEQVVEAALKHLGREAA